MSQTIRVRAGWNWFSLNVWNDDLTVAMVMGTLTDATGAFVKNLKVCVFVYSQICGNW